MCFLLYLLEVFNEQINDDVDDDDDDDDDDEFIPISQSGR